MGNPVKHVMRRLLGGGLIFIGLPFAAIGVGVAVWQLEISLTAVETEGTVIAIES